MDGPRAAGATGQKGIALRLALGRGYWQWRPRQSRCAPDGYVQVGDWRRHHAKQGRFLRRSIRL